MLLSRCQSSFFRCLFFGVLSFSRLAYNVNYCTCSELTETDVAQLKQIKTKFTNNKIKPNIAISTIYCYILGFFTNKKNKIMSEFKQTVDCSYCGSKDTVTLKTKQSKYSRSIQIVKCVFCKMQNGIKEVLNRSCQDY